MAGAVDRHREVRRQRTADEACATPPPPPEDEATFSDDSLEGSERGEVVEGAQRAQLIVAGDSKEDVVPSSGQRVSTAEDVVLSPGHRGSIAWEVPLDDILLTPGSTKVVGRRRRHSNERSSE